jgi:pyruvate,water dikinase
MDIEWAVENNKLYILQARPITTLKEVKEKITYTKAYTRDTSIIMQQAWASFPAVLLEKTF